MILLTPGFPENEADTTCLPFLQTHIGALNENFPNLEIIIITFQYPFFKSVYKWRGNEVISFGGKERGKIHRLLLWVRVWRKLARLRRTKNVIGLFSLWHTECALVGGYFGRFHDLTHYTWLCGQDAKKGNKYVNLARPHADGLVAMSDFLKREFFKNYGVDPAHVIPIGVDPDEFSNGKFERTIDVLGAGSLIPLKQYDIFVIVINRLRYTMPDIRAELCGSGPEESRLKSLVAEQHLGDHVILHGEIPHSEVLQLMQTAKIFLHTSNYEGFGTVCLEALYAGAHVVSFTKPMDSQIEHWHHVSDEEEMVKKVTELLRGPIEHQSIRAYTAADVAGSIVALFH